MPTSRAAKNLVYGKSGYHAGKGAKSKKSKMHKMPGGHMMKDSEMKKHV